VSAELDGARSVDGGFRYGGISLTADGGRTWRTTTLPGCYACANTHLSFLDDRSGFALTLGEDAHAKIVRRLYRTTDGGRRWELVRNMPFSGRIEFTGPKTGWALTDPARWLQTGCCAIPVEEGIVYRTLDGGYTWHRVALPTPARAMRFFGPRDGVVAVLPEGRRRHRRRVGVYTTSDGGSTWTAHSAPAAADQSDSRQGIPDFPFSAASVSDWALFAHGTLFRTRDGGRTWTTVDPTPRPQPSVWSVDFATPSRGWAIFAAGEAGAALVRTTDGGRTWAPLAPPR
jgi:photosystem II stability/assembly factor-like uncharacterized protein